MNAKNSTTDDHQDVWELLPWLINGRLGESDCRRVEAHLRLCGACREEYAAQQRIYDVMSSDTAVEQMPVAGLNRLRQRIEEAERAVGIDAPSEPACPPGAPRAILTPRFRGRAAAVAASVIALSVALGMPAALRWNQARRASAAYHTVTTEAAQHPGEVIRAVFAPTATLSELQAILDDAHLEIVSGPTEAGVYSLSMTGPQSIDWSLRRLREHDSVRFAEALAPARVPAPPP
jgi:hypothetical protein